MSDILNALRKAWGDARVNVVAKVGDTVIREQDGGYAVWPTKWEIGANDQIRVVTPAASEPEEPVDPEEPGEDLPPGTDLPPATDSLPIIVTNRSGKNAPVRIYVLVVNLNTDQLGYIDSQGRFHAWALPGGPVPVPAPDVSIAGPENGGELTLNIPRNMSGRIYFAYEQPLDFGLVDAGLVQPVPWEPASSVHDVRFDWTEFTFNDYGLWINSSQVDHFASPHTVSVVDNDATRTTGTLKPGGFQAVVDALEADPAFKDSVQRDAAGEVLRVIAPSKASIIGVLDPHYLDPAIDEAWKLYETETLVVVPFAHEPETKFYGQVSGGVLRFTDGDGQPARDSQTGELAEFEKPSTDDVWGADGALFAPNDHVVGPIARTIAAALHRGNLSTVQVQPGDPESIPGFYQTDPCNTYSRVIHEQMVDGKAYGFAFDDVANQESLVHSGAPVWATISLDPYSGEAGDAPTPVEPVEEPGEDDDLVVTIGEGHPGYATLTLGPGTTPGAVTIAVAGSQTTVSVGGPGDVRFDLTAPPGRYVLDVSSTGSLGSVKVTLP